MKLRFYLLFAVQVMFLASCSRFENPLNIDMKPKHEPMYNFTQSSALLGCVGGAIDQSSLGSVDVYISTIPDHTTPPIVSGFLTKDAVMMVTTALGRLNTGKVAIVGKNGGIKGRRQVQVLGAFTELNRTVQSRALSSDIILPGGIDIGAGMDSNVNHIALDLAMSERNRIITGSPTSVSVHILGSGGDATITYDDGGDFAIVGAIGYSRQEGFHSASRLLIETSVAIMMANFYGLDIKDCLQKNKKSGGVVQKTPYDKPVFHDGRDNATEEKAEPIAAPIVIKRGNKSKYVRRSVRNTQSNKKQSRRGERQFNDGYKPTKDNIDFSSKQDVEKLLLNAGITLNGALIEGRSNKGSNIYSWNIDGVSGQLYNTSQVDKNKFSFMVNKYLEDYIANCDDGGVTSSKKEIPFEQNRLIFYELGCTNDDGNNVADGVLFLERNNGFSIVSHRSLDNNKNAWRFNRGVVNALKHKNSR